jgi:broad specificity phosphatase PhoE
MTSTILWMRHGTCTDACQRPDANARPTSPLTFIGAYQTIRTADEIAGSTGAVVSSTLMRARSTTRIVATCTGLALLPAYPVFDEWHAPACVLGRAPAQYPDAYKEWRRHRAQNPDDALPGGESLTAFRDRALGALQTAEHLARAHGRLVIVSHRLLIGAVTALRSGTHDAAEVFEAARTFMLKPAALHVHDLEGSP